MVSKTPRAVVLFGEHIRGHPFKPQTDSIGQRIPTRLFVGEFVAQHVRLVNLFIETGPAITGSAYARGATATPEGLDLMARAVFHRLEEDYAGRPFWAAWGRRERPFDALDRELRTTGANDGIDRDVELLDIAGAWLDAYARLPGIPWLIEAEARYCAGLDDLLRRTTLYARRNRDIVWRSEIGTGPIIEQPLRRYLVDRPDWSDLDDKLREAEQELDAGNNADAITDTGAALQILLGHLGYAGKTLSDQMKQARRDRLFSRVDARLGDAVEALCEWIGSVRNQRGDAHPGEGPDPADAQLVFRIVASLALRFAAV